MRVAGIVAEYNPFHTGHAYHLHETRRVLGPEGGLVCVMSGHWVQRGECAAADKWSRAGAALRGGADLVLELNTVWAAASAEAFARGAVGALAATGVVDGLSFGSEDGHLEDLTRTAACLDTPLYQAGLRRFLDEGLSFAAARQAAVRGILGAAAECLSTPNNNLAVEYLRALPPGMETMTVPRVGAGHDGGILGGYASASALRAWLRGGEGGRAVPYLTEPWAGEIASMAHCERAALARLRAMGREELERCPDSGAGLAVRVLAAAGRAGDLAALYAGAKTKRYAHARIRRLVLWGYLGLTTADRPEHIPYLRVLGLNGRGREILHEMRKRAACPVVTKPAHARGLAEAGQKLFALEARNTDLYGLCFPTPRPSGLEWTTNPVVLP